MTTALENALFKDRYAKGYARSLEDRWPIRIHTRKDWIKCIADPTIGSAYIEGRLAGEKELRLRKLLKK